MWLLTQSNYGNSKLGESNPKWVIFDNFVVFSQNIRTLVCIRYLAFASGSDNKNHNNIEVNNAGISANEKNIVSTDYTVIVSISAL